MTNPAERPSPTMPNLTADPCPGGCQATGTVNKWTQLPNGQSSREVLLCPKPDCEYRARAQKRRALDGVPELAGAKSKRQPAPPKPLPGKAISIWKAS